MKVYKGFTASPGLVLGQVSRLDRPPLVFGEGPFHPEPVSYTHLTLPTTPYV